VVSIIPPPVFSPWFSPLYLNAARDLAPPYAVSFVVAVLAPMRWC